MKLLIELDPESWHGYGTETVWIELISETSGRILNTPFFARGLSLDDVVEFRKEKDQLVCSSVLSRSGHSTYRIFLAKDKTEEQFAQHWRDLEQLGCTYESMSNGYRLFAVDVPPSIDIERAYTLMQRAEEAGVWEFEEGHCEHVAQK